MRLNGFRFRLPRFSLVRDVFEPRTSRHRHSRRHRGTPAHVPERLEERRLLAFDLVAAYAQSTTPFYVAGTTAGTVTLDQAPQQLTLRFSPGVTIDSNTLGNISVIRSGRGGDAFGGTGSVADVTVTPGSIAVDDLPNRNQVIIRFAEVLPDDSYQIRITNGLTAGGGTNAFSQASQSVALRLDLGAQVVSVVPQPVLRQKIVDFTALPIDGDRLSIAVRGGTKIFEFDANSVTSPGNQPIPLLKAGGVPKTATELRDDVIAAINVERSGSGAFVGELAAPGTPSATRLTLSGTSFSPVVAFTRGGSVPASSPVAIIDGVLTQGRDKVVVSFNSNDPLDKSSAESPAFYQLFDTNTGNGSNVSVAVPTAVSYDAVSGTAVLSFAAGVIGDGKTYRLQVGLSPDSNNTLARAVDAGTVFTTSGFSTTAFLGEASLNDVDLYKVRLAANGTLTAVVSGFTTLSPIIRLFNASGGQVASGTTTVNQPLTAGIYYVGISSAGNTAYATDGTGGAGGTTSGSYALSISSGVGVSGSDQNSSFAAATALGTLGTAVVTVNAAIDVQATVATPVGSLQFGTPAGGLDQPGMRSTPHDSGSHGCATTTVADAVQTPVKYYNFQAAYGTDPYGNALTNLITEDQKQRAREVFEIYSRYTGMRFIESDNQGYTIVTGDMRALSPLIPPNGPIGLAGGSMAIMSSLVNWGSSDEYGGTWFETAMHEIGHLLGLQHSYDLPSIMGGGLTGEKVYPGDYDELQLTQYYQTNGSDIDVYSFSLDTAGTVTAETFVARPGQQIASTLDSVITVYRTNPSTGARELIARNDDSYGRDSFLSLDLEAGNYFVVVTSAGNTNFNPEVEDSGGNGVSDGNYQLRLGFAPVVRTDTTIVDATQKPLDGDRDGAPGGAFNFWFNTATTNATIFVDKTATAITTTSTYAFNASTLTLATVAGLAAGMKVTGTGIPAGTLIGTVNVGANQITLINAVTSAAVQTTLSGTNATLTFGGTLAAPFKTLTAAVASAGSGGIVRVVGNTGNASNPLDDQPYLVGRTAAGATLADGLRVNVPAGVTLMIDESALFKMSGSVIDVGSSQPNVSRAGAALQVLGTPTGRVMFTSFNDDTAGLDVNGVGPAPAGGDWGGIVLRKDSDSASKQIFVNSVTNANFRYGGGSVLIDSQQQSITPLHLVGTRPTVAFNTITDSSGAGISADPNSFEDTTTRVGPEFRGNVFVETRNDGPGNTPLAHQNSINGVFVRINTSLASTVDTLSVPARFKSRDVVYVITENLLIAGGAGGYERIGGVDRARDTGRLQIDPGVVVKLQSSRIELERGTSQLIAEGLPGQPVVFTSFGDNRYGAGGTFDTNGILPDSRTAGDWGGIFLNVGAKASLDNAYIGFGGGQTPIEGGYSTFDVIEVHQGDLRLTNSRIERNAASTATSDRTGRGTNSPATIFVRGAQPVILGNDFRDNAGATVSINANSLTERVIADPGRSTGGIARVPNYDANYGPLVRDNRLTYAAGLSATVGMVVRAEEITTETVWDDTDIVHVLTGEIIVQNFNAATGIRLQSDTNASLVVKLLGVNAGITAAGYALEIDDRIGGTVHIVGAPGYPVVMTSLTDDTVGASTDASGIPVNDTNNDGASIGSAGQWRGLRFLPLSNDRNVEILNEFELPRTTGGDINGTVGTAQVLGTLGPNFADPSGLNTTYDSAQEKGGDDNRRLGFQVQGAINLANPRDVDVYSFTGYAGSEVWLDIDKTSPALDTMLELLDADGNVLARSTDSQQVTNVTNVTLRGADTSSTVKTFQLQQGVMGATLTGMIYLGGGSTQTFTYVGGTLAFANANGTPAVTVRQTAGTATAFNPATGVLTLEFTSAVTNGAASIVATYSYSPLTALTLDPLGLGGPQPLTQPLAKDPLKGGDGYSVNPRDAGMRVILPGTAGQVIQYYVRVRSQPRQDSATLAAYGQGSNAANYQASLRSTTFDQAGDPAAGATSGRYDLRIRLRQADEKPGSTVRYADIRFPTIGIDVLGLPRNSALLGETGESTADNDLRTGAQELGNLLTTDRNTISVAGALTSAADVDWYTFTLNYEQIQSIGGVNSGGKTWSTVFDIDYGDGFRGDYTLSVFDRNFNLIYVGRDSNIPDDALLAGASQGAAAADLARGSFGALDPFIGPVQMNAGTPTQPGRQTNDGSSAIPASSSTFRYYVAVSSNEYLPAALDATFRLTSTAAATNSLVRLEPVNSTTRVVEDHIGFTGYNQGAVAPTTGAIIDTATNLVSIGGITVTNGSTSVYIDAASGSTAALKVGMYASGAGMPTPAVIRSIDGPQLFTLSAPATLTSTGATLRFYDSALDAHVRAFTLADVTLFVATAGGLFTYDATTGGRETTINNSAYSGLPIGDLDMRPDGRLYAYAGMTNNTANVGQIMELDTGTGAISGASADGIADKATSPLNYQTSSDTVLATAFGRTNTGTYGELYLVVRSGSSAPFTSKFYRAATGGTAASGGASATANQAWNDANALGYRGNIQVNGADVVVTGLQFIQDTSGTFLYGVTDAGLFIRFSPAGAGKAGSDTAAEYNFQATVLADFGSDLAAMGGGLGFTALAAAPQNLYDGLFRGKFFACTTNGNLVLLDPATTLPSATITAGSVTATGATPTPTLITVPSASPSTAGIASGSLAFGSGFTVGTTVTTNTPKSAFAVTLTDTGDLVTRNNHGLPNGAPLTFTTINTTTGITQNTTYFVVNATANTFQVANAPGGTALALTTDGTGTVSHGSVIQLSQAATGNQTYTAMTSPTNGSMSFVAPAATAAAAGLTATSTALTNVTASVTQGMVVIGTNIPANTIVTGRTSATAITISNAATATGPQALSFLRVTASRTGNTTNGSVTVSNLSKVSDLRVGMLVFGQGFQDNTRIASIDRTNLTITLTLAPTGTVAGNMLSFVNTSAVGYVSDWATNFNGSPAIPGSVTGIAFSPLDINLWHSTEYRGGETGHGINPPYDNTRPTRNQLAAMFSQSGSTGFAETTGLYSMYFGLETYSTTTSRNVAYSASTIDWNGGDNGQYGVVAGGSYNWQQELTANPAWGNAGVAGGTYAAPGGSYGSLITKPFSLAGSTYADKPTLYFNYWLDTPDASGSRGSAAMRDAARVFASTDGGQTWTLLATNNQARSSTDTTDAELPTWPTASSRMTSNANQIVQQLHDSASWRQARIDLGAFAAMGTIQLRFDFTTAGDYDRLQRDADGNLVNNFNGPFGSNYGDFNSAERGQNNSRGGFFIDDIVVGFTERGEMVTGTTGSTAETTFFNLATPTSQNSPPQSLYGPYQLTIRRGTEYGFQADPTSPDVVVIPLDTNTRFIPDTATPPVTLAGDGFETGHTFVQLQASGGTSTAQIVPQFVPLVPRAAEGARFAVLAGTADTDRARAIWTVTLANTVTSTLHTNAYLQFSSINTVGRNSLPATFVAPAVANAPAGQGVAVSVDNGVTWYALDDIGPTDVWLPSGFDVVAAMAARGLAGSTRIANGSATIIVPSTSGLFAGMAVTGTGIPGGTTVVSINSKTGITLSNPATATAAAVSLTFTPVAGTAVTFPGTVQIGFFQSRTGFVAIDDLQLRPSIPAPVTGTIGDRNPIRDQGQFLITNNVVRNASQYGISIDANVRDVTGIPHPGVPQNLRYLNTGRLAPGAVIANNIVAESGTAAIRFSGDSTATPAAAVPYGRIVNNTIFGGATFQAGLGTTTNSRTASVSASFIPYLLVGMTVSGTGIAAGTTITAINAAANTITLSFAATATGSPTATFTSPNVGGIGVAVSDNAAPTLLNNVFAQFSGPSGIGVSVDGTSRTDSAGNLRTVLGANAYYQVTTQISAGLTQNDAVTVTADPFVRSYAGNFYPARAVAGSPSIIDSSLNTLQDRNEYVNLISPLGMRPSPIIAPALDIYGQLRADDPTVASSPGLGANPFKDRGAIDRIDTTQPSVMLTTPLDESSADQTTGLSGVNIVRLERSDAANITRFVLQFSDTGIGIDKQSVTAGTVKVYYSAVAGVTNWAPVPEFNATVSNYLFRWLENTNQVVLESASVFAAGEYLITVDNSQVADLAGNTLLNNDLNGVGTTAFKVVLVDIPSKPTAVSGLPYATTSGAAQNGTRISLSWSAPASNGGTPVTSYTVQQQQSTDGGLTWSAWTASTFTAPTTTSAEVTGLVAGRLYQFRVTANNGVQPDVNLGPNWSDVLGPIAPLPTPTLALQSDSNISNDLYTNVGTVNVTGLVSGAQWQFSIDGGSSWSAVQNQSTTTSFTLSAGVTAAGTVYPLANVLVRQTFPTTVPLPTGITTATSLAGGFVAGPGQTRVTVDAVAAAPVFQLVDDGTSATDGITKVGLFNVSLEPNATWQYSTDGGTNWTAGTGSSFTLGDGQYLVSNLKVRQTDLAGNQSAQASLTLPAGATYTQIKVDSTPPSAPALVLAADTAGVSNLDGITSNGRLNVTGLEANSTWQYSMDGGTSWSAAQNQSATTFFTLTAGTYAVANLKVRQFDEAGNQSPNGGFTLPGGATYTQLQVDTTVAPPTVVLASGVSDPVSIAEGELTTGVIRVTGELGATIVLTFNGVSGSFARAGIVGTGGPQAVVLSPSEVAQLGHGAVTVLGSQTDVAGNVQSATQVLSFTLDLVRPLAPVLTYGAGVVNGATLAEATQPGGIVTVTGEPGATILVTFTRGTTVLTPAVLGNGAVVLNQSQVAQLGDGTVLVTARQTDAAGNVQSVADSQLNVTIDTTAPSILITSSTPTLRAGQTTLITFTLSEPSTTFASGAVTVAGGSLSPITGAGAVYTATFTPTAGSTTPGLVSVAVGTFTDLAGNANTAGSLASAIAIDTILPSVTVTSSMPSLRSGQTATLTFVLSESATDFVVGDVTPNGGTLSDFAGSGSTYTATFTPDPRSTVPGTIAVAAGVFADAFGNPNVAGALATPIDIDTVSPAALISVSPTAVRAGQTATVTFTLTEAATNFAAGDVSVTGGTLSGFTGSGAVYTAVFTPFTGSVAPGTISVAAGTFTDAFGNPNADTSLVPAIAVDTILPTVAIASSTAALRGGQTATITFTLSEPSTTFTSGAVTVAGGSLSPLAGSGAVYTATFTPTAGSTTPGLVSVAAGTFTDLAGNANTAGSLASAIAIDTVAPTVASIVSSVGSLRAGQTATISFTLSEPSATFGIDDLVASGGTLANFSGSGTTYSVTFTPFPNSTLAGVVTVGAGTFTDAAGNGNVVATLSPPIVIDTLAPAITGFSTTAANRTYAIGETIAMTATLSEPVQTGGTLAVTLNTGATIVLTATGGSSLSGTYAIQPGESATILDVAAITPNGSLVDLAGNPLTAISLPAPADNLAGRSAIAVDGAVKVLPVQNLSGDPRNVPAVKLPVVRVPITFTTPVTGVTLDAFRLLLNGRGVSLRGATVTGSGATYTLTLPSRRTTPRGIYTLEVRSDVGIRSSINGALMSQAMFFYWGRGQSVGSSRAARLSAFASLS